MTNTEIEVKLENHDNRIEALEQNVSGLQDLIISVKELTISVKNLTETSNELKAEVKGIKDEKINKWEKYKFYFFTTIIGIALGVLGSVLFKI